MKILTTKKHGLIDYGMGAGMILTPWILGFSSETMAACLLIASGGITIIHALVTDYECGIVNQVSMKNHLKMDILSGGLLIALALLLHSETYLPHIFFGVVKIVTGMITSPVPSYKGYHGYTYKKFEKFPPHEIGA